MPVEGSQCGHLGVCQHFGTVLLAVLYILTIVGNGPIDSNSSLGQIVGTHVKIVLGNTRRSGPRVVSGIDFWLFAHGIISGEDVASLAHEASPFPRGPAPRNGR